MSGDPDDWMFDDDDDIERPHGLRFGEGQPINKRGRPKGSPNRATLIKRVAKRRIPLKVHGELRKMSVLDAILHKFRALTSGGDLKAIALTEQLLPNGGADEAGRPEGVLYCSQKLTPEEWRYFYSLPWKTNEEVLEKFPHLINLVKKRKHPYRDAS